MADMSQVKLVEDLKAMLMDASKKFIAEADADFIRLLTFALADVTRVRPRRLLGSITLQAGVGEYDAPADLIKVEFPLWGNAERRTRKQWETNYPGPAPSVTVFGDSGSQIISLSPAPSATSIADIGSEYKFYYRAMHVISTTAENTTINQVDRDLLLIRATAQAMHELAANNISKPVKLSNGGIGSMPKNGTPAALAESLMKLFERIANE